MGTNPYQKVRYPKEDGHFKASQQQARSKWFQENLNMPKPEAEQLAFSEMEQLCVMEPGRMSRSDPLRTLSTIAGRAADSDAASAAYWDYFNQLDQRLIVEIPMQTFQRKRYHLGQNLDLYPNGLLPTPKNFFTGLARKLDNVGRQMALIGDYSDADERKIFLREKEMVRPADRQGFRPVSEDRLNQHNVERQQKHADRCRQAYKDDVMSEITVSEADQALLSMASERTYTTDESTMVDWSESSSAVSMDKPRPSKTTEILQRVEEILDADSTLESVKKLSLKETIQQRVAAKKKQPQSVEQPAPEIPEPPQLSLRQRLLQRSGNGEWEFEIDFPDSPTQSIAETVIPDDRSDSTKSTVHLSNSFPTIIRSRPKASTIGAYFDTPGSLISPLYASSIFPRAANTEKLHWEVAVGAMEADLERYDGQLHPQYLEDIRNHMKPIIEAMDYHVQDQWKFDRYDPESSLHMT